MLYKAWLSLRFFSLKLALGFTKGVIEKPRLPIPSPPEILSRLDVGPRVGVVLYLPPGDSNTQFLLRRSSFLDQRKRTKDTKPWSLVSQSFC